MKWFRGQLSIFKISDVYYVCRGKYDDEIRYTAYDKHHNSIGYILPGSEYDIIFKELGKRK